MGKEADYIQAVNKHLPPEIHSEGMANPYRGGTPDRYYEGNKAPLWVEYKYLAKLPPIIDLLRYTEKTEPMLSKLQQGWLRRAHGNGQPVAVIVGCSETVGGRKGGVIFPGTSWDKPISRDGFIQLMWTPKEIAAWITTYTTRQS